METELIHKLNTRNASKVALSVIKIAVQNGTFALSDLMASATDLNNEIHPKALRIAELIVEENVLFLSDYVPELIEIASKYKHVSAVRGISRILLFIISDPKIVLTDLQEKTIVETALDWFISDEKVATKVNALKIMTHFSGKFPWLKTTITELIEKEYSHQLPSYQIASRVTLAKFKL